MNYGVELEFVYAFHEHELEQHLGINTIKKNIPYAIREVYPHFSRMDPEKLSGHVYNSWGVSDKYTRRLRPYKLEPQEILKRHLDEKCPHIPTKLCGTLYSKDKNEKLYDMWLIAPDHTICGVGSYKISANLPNKQTLLDEWDSYGLELVSPVFNTDDKDGKVQIGQLLEATVGLAEDNYGAFITNQCGLHVHVEAPKDLRVLKELALLLIVYEESISMLHPIHRRPGHPSSKNILESNRLWWMLDDETKFDHSTDGLAKKYTISQLRGHFKFIKSKESLSRLMCWSTDSTTNLNRDRNRLVNFTSLTRGEGFPETIEFRQSAGSLDLEEISHWIDFCVDLVKFAAVCVEHPDKFPIKNWETTKTGKLGTPGLIHLMFAMGQNRENIDFWLNNRRKKLDQMMTESNTNQKVQDNSSDRVSRRKRRTTESSAEDQEIIRRNHAKRRATGITDTFEKGMNLQEQPQTYADQTLLSISQQHSNISSPEPSSNRMTSGSTKPHRLVERRRSSFFIPSKRSQFPPTRVLKHATPKNGSFRSRKPPGQRQGPTPNTIYSRSLERKKHVAISETSRPGSFFTPPPDLPEEKPNDKLPISGGVHEGNSVPLPPDLRHFSEPVKKYQSTPSLSTPPSTPPQTLDYGVIPATPLDFRAPGEIAEEPMSKDAFSWYVTDFNKADWISLPNGTHLAGRTSCCGILALSRAFKEQYPSEPYGYQDPKELLDLYDVITPYYRENVNASDEEMQALCDLLTGGSFALVVVQFQSHDFTERARRIGSDEQQEKARRNLYLRHMPGHWEPMRRKR